jgi:DNA-binding MarR family transcriptional regulator
LTDPRSPLFRVFNEIGIINQLATAVLVQRLPSGVHPSQFALLGNLMRLGDGKTPAELASAFQVPKASMTNTLMQLEKRNLIDVRPHAEDKRKKQVFLTNSGRDLYTKTVLAVAEPLARMTDQVMGLEEILPKLEELRRTLDENRDV